MDNEGVPEGAATSEATGSPDEKYCSKCRETHPIAQFNWRDRARGKYHSACVKWTRKSSNDAYYKNHAYYKAKVRGGNRAARAKLRRLVQEIKKGLACERCGYAEHPAALDFHHPPGVEKCFHIADVQNRRLGKAAILAEIAKCKVLCANCHRVVTAVERAAKIARVVDPAVDPAVEPPDAPHVPPNDSPHAPPHDPAAADAR